MSAGQAAPHPKPRGPKFGDLFENTIASPDNPRRIGRFVRVISRARGRTNPGTWWQMTDGRGDFWESNPENLRTLASGARAMNADEPADTTQAWGALSANRRADIGLIAPELYDALQAARQQVDATAACPACRGKRRVCERHPTEPWYVDDDGASCCGGAGAQCSACRQDA